MNIPGNPERKTLEKGRLTAFLDLCPEMSDRKKKTKQKREISLKENFNEYNWKPGTNVREPTTETKMKSR